ncbi:MAG TPA: homocysteine S-methyltransferase family protein [Solirubrobacterales bacterium]|nr:homocysteine S-methyltransferase family protein [Solirubrobacterales bacterium]
MRHRESLPQLGDELFLTDGGIETVLIFHEGLELPQFAAFDLLDDEDGTAALRRYYEPYLELARERGLGFVLESPTWRASPRWAAEIGHGPERLDVLNRKAIALMADLRDAHEDGGDAPIVISGCIGPHDDGYDPAELLSADAARDYHATQVDTFVDTAADLVTAITMTYAAEAIGVARAAAGRIPVVISFTVETDGRLPDGQPLTEAIAEVDAATDGAVAYYMINCAHPTHFDEVVEADPAALGRVRGLRANASRMSHAELDAAPELDDGDPNDLGARYASLRAALPQLSVVGGCCGTDHRHVAAIRDACLGEQPTAADRS